MTYRDRLATVIPYAIALIAIMALAGCMQTTNEVYCPEPEPDPEPEPPPETCVPSSTLDCGTAPWDSIPRTSYSLAQGKTLALAVQMTGEEGLTRRLASGPTGGNSPARDVAFSAIPGQFDGPNECSSSGSDTSTYWVQGSRRFYCDLGVTGTYYINVRIPNCRGTCQFFLEQ